MMRAIGRRLRGLRAPLKWRVAAETRFGYLPHTIELRSSAFDDGAPMPATAESPPLAWSGVPEGTAMLALVVEDLDVPLPRPVPHAVAYGIDPARTSLEAGELAADRLSLGYNVAGRRTYVKPSPIPGHGPHRYAFTLLAVDYSPRFDQPPTRGRLLDAIAGHVLALGELIGTVER
jgi:phosphatidylethanolamine-binding protein (PEBP) family uncharacterized protein